MIVVDNDVISYFWLQQASDRSEAARAVRRRDADWAASRLWRSEFRNVLRGYMAMELMTHPEALRYAEQAEADMAGSEHEVRTADVLRLVDETGHSAYDCEYVALAQALGVLLVSGDRQLVRLFPDTVRLLEDFAAA